MTPLARALAVFAPLLVAACARPAPRPHPVARGLDPAAAMQVGGEIADRWRVGAINDRRFTHARYWAAIEPALRAPVLRVEEVGRSIQGRAIRSITFGRGPVTVLLWSQMHGDESTASMALADIFAFLADTARHPLRTRLHDALTITFVPMLNPDGAELFQRENALGIDVNRDARRLSTPEGRALKGLHDRLRPQYGFNLHDQGARTRVGPAGLQAAIALLAPAYDADRGYNAVRGRARLVAATMARVLERDIPGRVAKYDDAFNPRAFGDLMQTWGTSTVLIESGAIAGDPQKQRLRRLNVVAILAALDAIAGGTHLAADPQAYESLPFNTGGAYDILVRGGSVRLPGTPPMLADVAINFDEPVARTGPRVREVGDLQAVVALDTIDATGLFLHPRAGALTGRGSQQWLVIGAPAAIDIRRGAESTSALVRAIGGPDR